MRERETETESGREKEREREKAVRGNVVFIIFCSSFSGCYISILISVCTVIYEDGPTESYFSFDQRRG